MSSSSLLAGALAVLVAPSVCWAEQFVLFDATFTFTKADADNATPSQSHYYVRGDAINPGRPTDWTAPVDYRNGTVHIRTEVIDKPAGDEVTQWVLCYIPNEGQGNGYGCTGTGTYTQEGLYERDVSMTSWWENESIVWSKGIQEMHLVMKDSDDGGGFAHLRPDPEEFFPTTMRITMIQVSAGSTYDPTQVPDLSDHPVGGDPAAGGAPGVDAGMDPSDTDSDADDGSAPDAPNAATGGTTSTSGNSGSDPTTADSPSGSGMPATKSQETRQSGCSVPMQTPSRNLAGLAMAMCGVIVAGSRRRRSLFAQGGPSRGGGRLPVSRWMRARQGLEGKRR